MKGDAMLVDISDLVRSNIRFMRELRARQYAVARRQDPNLPERNPFRKEHFHERCGLKAGQYRDLENGDLPRQVHGDDLAESDALDPKRIPKITVDRLVAIAAALDVNVGTLMLPPEDWVRNRFRIDVPAEDSTTHQYVLQDDANDFALWILGLEPLPGQSQYRFRHHAYRLLPYLDRAEVMDRDRTLEQPTSPVDMEDQRERRLPKVIADLQRNPDDPLSKALLEWESLDAILLNEEQSRIEYMSKLLYVDLLRFLLDGLREMFTTTHDFGAYTRSMRPGDEPMDEGPMEDAGVKFNAVLDAVFDRLLENLGPPQGR